MNQEVENGRGSGGMDRGEASGRPRRSWPAPLRVLVLLAGIAAGFSGPGLAQQAASATPTAEALAARSAALDRREQSLAGLEARFNARLEQLKQLEATLTTMLNEAKSIQQQRMVHLIDVYGNMSPPKAAAALEALDEPTAVKILSGMQGRKAGDILSNVSPKKAASLTDALTRFQAGPALPQKP